MQGDLVIFFKEVVSVVNFVKSRPLYTRLYSVLCDEMGAEHNGFCSTPTFVGYREERCWREWLTYETKLAPF